MGKYDDLVFQMKKQVDLDSEQARVNFNKFVEVGREIEAAKLEGSVSPADLEVAVQQAKRQGALEVLTDLDMIMTLAHDRASEVEAVDEDQKWAEIKAKYAGQGSDVLLADVETMLTTVDQKHGEIVAIEKAAIKAIKEKWAV